MGNRLGGRRPGGPAWRPGGAHGAFPRGLPYHLGYPDDDEDDTRTDYSDEDEYGYDDDDGFY